MTLNPAAPAGFFNLQATDLLGTLGSVFLADKQADVLKDQAKADLAKAKAESKASSIAAAANAAVGVAGQKKSMNPALLVGGGLAVVAGGALLLRRRRR